MEILLNITSTDYLNLAKFWAITGVIAFITLIILTTVIWSRFTSLSQLRKMYSKNRTDFNNQLIVLFMLFIFMGPFSIILGSIFTRNIQAYLSLWGIPIYSELFGTGKVRSLDISTVWEDRLMVWVSFDNYSEDILTYIDSLTSLDELP